MFRFAHGGTSALRWLCLAERMTGRRKRFAYGVEDWSLICSLAALIFCFLHGSISLFVRGWPRCYDALASGVNADFSDGKGRLLSKGVVLSFCARPLLEFVSARALMVQPECSDCRKSVKPR